jgi:WD40 repeat protein
MEQQRHPLRSSSHSWTIPSEDFVCMLLSIPVDSPNSFRMTAIRLPCSSVNSLLISVDFPLPRNPVTMVTGILLLALSSGFSRADEAVETSTGISSVSDIFADLKKMSSFQTIGFNPYAVEFSPFSSNRLACASGANFGIVGNGRLFILSLSPSGFSPIPQTYDTQDGLFDCAWSESNENQIVAACGDGSIKLFDTTLPVSYFLM